MDKKILLSDQFLKCVQMCFEGKFTQLCDFIRRIWFLPNELLFHFHIHVLFQCGQMAGKVSIRDVQHLLQCFKITGVVHHKNGHNPQSYSVLEGFIKMCDYVFHSSYFSYFTNMATP